MTVRRVRYRTVVKDLTEVEMDGVASCDRDAGWMIGDDFLNDWLDKFDGRKVTLSIKAWDRAMENDNELLATVPEDARP